MNRDPDGVSFWSAGLVTGKVYKFALSPVGPPVVTFDSVKLGNEVAGLAVFGELVVAQPSPTPTPAGVATPTPTPIVPAAVVPTLSFPMLGLLAAALLAAAVFVLMRR